MLRTAPTYALRTEAGLTPCPCILHGCEGLKDEGGFAASEPLFCTIGGGQASSLISSDYSKLYSLLRALSASAGSRLFRVYT